MKYYGSIYKITNKLDNKIYIGQTTCVDPLKRALYHFKPQKNHISYVSRAIQKHGKDNFIIEIICTTFDQEQLNNLEIHFINHFNCIVPNGYNLKFGGSQGGKCSEEIKQKLSEKRKGIPSKGKAAKGNKKSEEHRKSMSESRKGFTSENRKKAHKKMVETLKLKVKATNLETNEELIFDSIVIAANTLNVQRSNIGRVCNKKQGRTQAGGYKFEFLETKLRVKNRKKACKKVRHKHNILLDKSKITR